MFISKKKQKEFFEKIKKTKPIVLATINKYLWHENIQSIDDVAQEIYLNAYRSLVKNQFRSEAKIETWLYTITKNQCLKTNRESLLNKMFVSNGEEKLINLSDKKDKVDKELSKEQKEILQKIIDKLPEKYKKVISLFLDGYQEKEIALVMDKPIGTIKSRKHKAIEKLKLIGKRSNYELG